MHEEAVERAGDRADRVLHEAHLLVRRGVASITAPPTASECPPRYFVVECTTAAAPSSSGRWLTGVANVLSTTMTASPRATTAARSTVLSVGFVGVSTQTSFVSGRTACATGSRSRWSTIVYSRPQRVRTLSTSR